MTTPTPDRADQAAAVKPSRIQRTMRRGWRAPLDPQGRRPVYVGRPGRWGNPNRVVYRKDTGGWHVENPTSSLGAFAYEREARRFAVEAYRAYLDAHPDLAQAARAELAGRNLMCWCPLPAPGEPDHCHGAVLLRVAAGEAP